MDIAKHVEEVREEFPVLKYATYMNSAAQGPSLGRARDLIADWLEFHTYLNQGMKAPDARGEAAKMLGVDAGDVTWVNRVSQACNIVSSVVKMKKGDNIVITDLGYPTGSYPFLPWRSRGVEIRSVGHDENGIIATRDFEKAVDDRTRVVSLSHIEWTSGLLHDVKAITDVAHAHGALVLDDGYQAQGNVDVKPGRDGVDFYTFGSQKWMCNPLQAGVLYVPRGVADRLEPTYMNYNNVEEAFRSGAPWEKPTHDNIVSWDHPTVAGAEKFNQGCVQQLAVWSFHASFEYFNGLGVKEIEKRNRGLSGYLMEGLREFKVKVNTPEDPKRRGGLVTYSTGKHEDNQRLFSALTKEGIRVALRYAAGVGGIRVSTHFFNTEEEIDRLLKVQRKTLG